LPTPRPRAPTGGGRTDQQAPGGRRHRALPAEGALPALACAAEAVDRVR